MSGRLMNVIIGDVHQSSEGCGQPLGIACRCSQLLCQGWNQVGDGDAGERTGGDRGNGDPPGALAVPVKEVA